MQKLKIDNYILDAPVIDVLRRLQLALTNGKLRDIKVGSENIVVTCPDHDGGREAHPACNIYIGDNPKIEYGYFNCFVCNSRGNFLTFVAHCFETSEAYAKSWLLKNFEGAMVEHYAYMGDDIQVGKRKQKTVQKLDESILDQYQKWTPYLGQRKLSRELCEFFKVRYDPKYRQVIFPAYDIHGNLVMLPKRSIDTKTFYLDKEVEKPVYCLNYIMQYGYKTAVIVEGPFDCLTGWQYGYPTIGMFGQISDYQIEQINKSCINVLYVAFDNDESGELFRRILRSKLSNRIILVDVKLPKGKKDINDLTKDEFLSCMQKASNSF
jgi:DNA primase